VILLVCEIYFLFTLINEKKKEKLHKTGGSVKYF
jgi:hypothetical protein